ncbi:MAG: hypothetical protein K0R10_1075 [Alphaproteobacteria bacterium]|nr:hypothetical protein [Alphaproteobacteria bacterium]
MFENIISSLGLFNPAANANIHVDSRRAPRHDGMQVQVMIGRRGYKVHDWSRNGISFDTPDHKWNVGRVYYEEAAVPEMVPGEVQKMTLRFSLLQGAIDIPVEAEILRNDGERTVAQLSAMNKDISRKFDRVIDSFNAQKFLESQSEQYQA